MMKALEVHAFTIVHNEENFVRIFIEHYFDSVDRIFIFANNCTDETIPVARSYGNKVFVEKFDVPFSNFLWSKIKAEFVRKSKADFCIASDVDELIFPKDFRGILRICRECGITVPRTMGYHMVTEKFDFGKDSIYEVTKGVRDKLFDKKIVVDPRARIMWGPGQHEVVPQECGGVYCESPVPMLQLRHFKYLGFENLVKRNQQVAKRLNKDELKAGFGFHHLFSLEDQERIFRKYLEEAVFVV